MITRKKFFIIARIVMIFLIGLVVAAFIALSKVNLETLRGEIIHAAQSATGMPVEIDGDISWKFSLRPKIELNKIKVENFVTIDHADVTLNILSLLRGALNIRNVKVYDVDVTLNKDENGKYIIPRLENTEHHKEKTRHDTHFPFDNPGIGGVEINGLVVNSDGVKYNMDAFKVDYVSRRSVREFNGWIRVMDELYPFIISFSKYNSERKVYPVKVAMSADGKAIVANIALEGTSLLPIDFTLKGDIPDIAKIFRAINIEIPKLPEIAVDMAGGMGHGNLTLRKSSVNIGGSDLTISGKVDWAGKNLSVDAKIKSNEINLIQVFPELYAPGKPWVRPNRPLHIFHNVPFYGTWMLNKNANIELNVANLLVYRELAIGNINSRIKLATGDLRVDTTAKFAGGDVRAALDLHTDEKGVLSAVGAGFIERVITGEILKQVRETDLISDLPADGMFYLRGHGKNLSQMMASLTGPIYIQSTARGYIHSGLMSYVYGTDFITDLRHQIEDIFTGNKRDSITANCAVVNLKLRGGRVDTTTGIAIETNAINMRMAGTADLGAETIKASMITVPVRGLKISLTGGIVNSMTFSGNMAEPDIKIDAGAVAGKVAAGTGLGLLLAPLTGGLSLVAGAGLGLVAGDFLENWLADPEPCKTAGTHGAPPMEKDPHWLNRPLPELVNEIINGENNA